MFQNRIYPLFTVVFFRIIWGMCFKMQIGELNPLQFLFNILRLKSGICICNKYPPRALQLRKFGKHCLSDVGVKNIQICSRQQGKVGVNKKQVFKIEAVKPQAKLNRLERGDCVKQRASIYSPRST